MEGAPNVETERARCFDLAAAAFSNNQMSLELYERLAGEIASASDLNALQVIEEGLPAPPPALPVTTQLITASGSKVAKSGRWVESSRVSLKGAMSKVILDFGAYESERDFHLDLEFDCKASDVCLVVPSSIDVIERLSSSSMSVFKDKHGAAPATGAIVISGSLAASKVRVKRKRSR